MDNKKEVEIQVALGSMKIQTDCGDWCKHLWEPLAIELLLAGGRVTQIKSKFGGLRFYYINPGTWGRKKLTAFAEKVSKAEAESFQVPSGYTERIEP